MLPRFQRILVPVDIAGHSANALEMACELASENKAIVSMLHVIQAIDPDDETPDTETKEFYEHLEQRLDSELNVMAGRLRDAGIDVNISIRVGDRLRDITEFASEKNIDLIIMACRKVDPAHLAATWGTLGYKVSVLCECPIMLLK